jgi:hypothetical protein
VVVDPLRQDVRRPKDDPVVELAAVDCSSTSQRMLLVQNETARATDGRLVVVHENDSASVHEAAEVDEVEEGAVETVIAVDEREIEAAALGHAAR